MIGGGTVDTPVAEATEVSIGGAKVRPGVCVSVDEVVAFVGVLEGFAPGVVVELGAVDVPPGVGVGVG